MKTLHVVTEIHTSDDSKSCSQDGEDCPQLKGGQYCSSFRKKDGTPMRVYSKKRLAACLESVRLLDMANNALLTAQARNPQHYDPNWVPPVIDMGITYTTEPYGDGTITTYNLPDHMKPTVPDGYFDK